MATLSNTLIVNTSTANTQSSPHIGALFDGRQVVSWVDYGASTSTLKFKILNADGSTFLNETIANPGQTSAGNIGSAGGGDILSVTALTNGGFVIAWQYRNGSDENIFYRVFNGNGAGGAVNQAHNTYTTGTQIEPDVTWTNTGFTIAWEDSNTLVSGASSTAIMSQDFNFAGTALGAATRFDTGATGTGTGSVDIAYANGRLAGAWYSNSPRAVFGKETNIGDFRADDTTGSLVSVFGIADPSIAYGFNATFTDAVPMVVWAERPTFADSTDIWGSIGGNGGTAFKINTSPINSGELSSPTVTGLQGGGWIVVWSDGGAAVGGSDYDVIGQIYNANGVKVGGEFVITDPSRVNNNLSSVEVDSLADGRALVTWSAGGPSTSGGEVFARYIDPRVGGQNITGDNNNNQLVGTSSGDIINAGGGNDRIWGEAGNDRLDGGTGNDTMSGGIGQDVYICNAAGDQTIETTAGTAGGIDVVEAFLTWLILAANIEILRILGTGNFNANGNTLDNTITGNNGANGLDGKDGKDTIFGRGGNDTLLGGNGNDILNGEDGNDKLNGGLGVDRLTGGSGKDTFIFNTTPSTTLNRDTITDFRAVDDVIHIDNAVFAALGAPGNLGVRYWASANGLAHDANDRIIYNTTNGAITYDSNGNVAGGTIVQIAILQGHPAITAADFLVI